MQSTAKAESLAETSRFCGCQPQAAWREMSIVLTQFLTRALETCRLPIGYNPSNDTSSLDLEWLADAD